MHPALAPVALGLGLALFAPASEGGAPADDRPQVEDPGELDADADVGGDQAEEQTQDEDASQQSVDAGADATDAAKDAFDAGLSAVASGEFEAAVEAFEQAYRLRPHPVALFNLALALERAERYVEAWELFHATLPLVESKKEREEIRAHLGELDEHVAVLRVEAMAHERLCIAGADFPTTSDGEYRVALAPGSHELLLDASEIGIELQPGEHRFMVLDNRRAEPSRERRLGPAMTGVAIGAGLAGVGLGVGAALVEPRPLQVGFGAGAAAAAGLAVGASIIALVAQRKKKRRRARERLACPGAPGLGERIDLRLVPMVELPAEFPVSASLVPKRRPSLLATRPRG